mmetsp:Transcript_17536/g.61645  ORF Transcript_17536/g.61645 Transcript_17536/m.61645 type:complete len:593 (+) Transcript_17536:271-2049(+)
MVMVMVVVVVVMWWCVWRRRRRRRRRRRCRRRRCLRCGVCWQWAAAAATAATAAVVVEVVVVVAAARRADGRRDARGALELPPHVGQLRLELRDDGVRRVLVHDRRVDDGLGALQVLQRRQRLLKVDGGRRHGRDHHRLAVAAQALLEQASEHRVAVRHERRAAAVRVGRRQRLDHRAQRAEAAVDGAGLLEPVAAHARRVGALAARQVDEVDLAHLLPHGARRAVGAALPEAQREERVRAAGQLVHLRGGRRALLAADEEQLLDVVEALDGHVQQVLHVRAVRHVLAHAQRPRGGVEEVAHALVVDLAVGDVDAVLHVHGAGVALALAVAGRARAVAVARRQLVLRRLLLRRALRARDAAAALRLVVVVGHDARQRPRLLLAPQRRHALEQRAADARDQPQLRLVEPVHHAARAHHRVRLARARLPVGEDGAVEALPRVLQHARAQVVKDALLAGVIGRHIVVRVVRKVVEERPLVRRQVVHGLAEGRGVRERHRVGAHGHAVALARRLLRPCERPHAHGDAHRLVPSRRAAAAAGPTAAARARGVAPHGATAVTINGVHHRPRAPSLGRHGEGHRATTSPRRRAPPGTPS